MVSACVYASIDLLEREQIESQSMKAALLYTTDIVCTSHLTSPLVLLPPSYYSCPMHACIHTVHKVLHFQNCGSFKFYMQGVGRQ